MLIKLNFLGHLRVRIKKEIRLNWKKFRINQNFRSLMQLRSRINKTKLFLKLYIKNINFI